MSRGWILGSLLVAMSWAGAVSAESSTDRELRDLDRRVDGLQQRMNDAESALRKSGEAGVALFLFGAFCALWAQNTQRNAWLWFFLGLFFNFIAVIFLLSKNATDRDGPGPAALL